MWQHSNVKRLLLCNEAINEKIRVNLIITHRKEVRESETQEFHQATKTCLHILQIRSGFYIEI
jgi:hypothetical protein